MAAAGSVMAPDMAWHEAENYILRRPQSLCRGRRGNSPACSGARRNCSMISRSRSETFVCQGDTVRCRADIRRVESDRREGQPADRALVDGEGRPDHRLSSNMSIPSPMAPRPARWARRDDERRRPLLRQSRPAAAGRALSEHKIARLPRSSCSISCKACRSGWCWWRWPRLAGR